MFSPTLKDVPPPRIEIFLNMNTIDSLAFMFSLIYPLPFLANIHFYSVKCTEKKTYDFQVQLEFWVNMIFWFLADVHPPPPFPRIRKNFLSEVRFDFANVPPSLPQFNS